MSLQRRMNLVFGEYLYAKSQSLTGHPIAELIRQDIPTSIEQLLTLDTRYIVQGSPGRGNWAAIPWIGIFDRFITETAQNGYYLVYLFKEDFSGVYLSLNQGVTSIREIYGSDAKQALKARAHDYSSRLGKTVTPLITGPIDLEITSTSTLGAFYEQGSICAKYYPRDMVPDDSQLERDLREFLSLYLSLATKDLVQTTSSSEEDESGLETEDLTTLREHKRMERNQRLSAKAKQIHGYTCQACGFDFERTYGEIGHQFIEAHHLTPLHTLKGQKVSLDPRKDFSVLCANCHRMIHRSEFVHDIVGFRKKYL